MFDFQVKQKRIGRPEKISERGYEMMYAIWRYGSLGTKAIHHLIAPKDSPYGVSKELIKLEGRGLIEGVKSWPIGFRWTMTPKGYDVLHPHIAEKIGLPVHGVERRLSEVKEAERDRLLHFQQNTAILHETIMALCPTGKPQGVLMRELSASKIQEKNPWLPKIGRANPASFVHWPDGREGKTFVIDILPNGRTLYRQEQFVKSYVRLKVDKIFLVCEKDRMRDDFMKFSHRIDVIFKYKGYKHSEKWHILQGESIETNASVFDMFGKNKGQLSSLLLGQDESDFHGALKIKKMTQDFAAKPKVCGRAYQR